MKQMTLLGWNKRYPDKPGYKEPTTSKEAAEKMESKQQVLWKKAYLYIKESGMYGATPDEVANYLEEDILNGMS